MIFSDPRLPAKYFFLLCFLDLEKKLLRHIKEKTVRLIKKRKQVAATSYWLGKMLKW